MARWTRNHEAGDDHFLMYIHATAALIQNLHTTLPCHERQKAHGAEHFHERLVRAFHNGSDNWVDQCPPRSTS